MVARPGGSCTARSGRQRLAVPGAAGAPSVAVSVVELQEKNRATTTTPIGELSIGQPPIDPFVANCLCLQHQWAGGLEQSPTGRVTLSRDIRTMGRSRWLA
jgi:hypothetical protein